MRSRLARLFLSLPLFVAAVTMPPDARAECSEAGGWEDCVPIGIDLQPLKAGGSAVEVGVVTGLSFTTLEADGAAHVVVADKGGTVAAHDLATGQERTLVSIEGTKSVNPERGLLGMALHPDFPATPTLFTYHTSPRTDEANAECDRLPPFNSKNLEAICAKGERYGCGGSFHVTEWTFADLASDDPSATASSREVLERKQPGEGHNAGHLLFGPDGMLYLSLGDGGGQMDPCSRGQDHSAPYSSILRLDPGVDGAVAAGNPFIGVEGYDPLIWAYGFRNPWRMHFIPEGVDGVAAGQLIVADTGQARYEEINVVRAGANHGWSVRDGTLNHPGKGEAPPSDLYVAPLFQYGDPKGKTAASGGYAVVGGVVATGEAVPALKGMYLFGDNVRKNLWALDLASAKLGGPHDGKAKVHRLKGGSLPPSTFARDPNGDVYVGGSGGKIFKIVAP